jgi:4-hydroxy-tetrahydrodipicolinate synthase
MKLEGLFNVLSTPLNEDHEIDLEIFEREIEWLIKCGMDGAVLAMVSEVMRLSAEERRQQWQIVVKQVRGRIPVVASVGAESTHIATSLARFAEADGVSALMATPPTSFPATNEEVFAYYTAIIESVKIPVIVQDASNYMGQPLEMSLYAQLLEKYGNDRVQFKPEAKPVKERMRQLQEVAKGKAKVFEGQSGTDLLDTFPLGLVGTMPGSEVPWAIVALWNALKEDNWDFARRIHEGILSLMKFQPTLDAYVAVEKYILVKQGIFTSTRQRGPVGTHLSDADKKGVDSCFDALKATVKAK